MKRVVADSSCLIGLAQIKQFDLLKHLFSQVHIPDAVYEEVVVKGEGEVGSEEAESAVKDGWIIKRTVKDEIAISALTTILGKGESEVIILYKESSLDYALLDERTARDMAELMNVKTMGVLGVINLAIDQGFALDKKELVEQLREAGFRISDKLYRRMFPG
ncbi:MAG: nucleic acid-binding protein [bacterium]|nr:MAG: nucleic acid-binding protein [bacterium]